MKKISKRGSMEPFIVMDNLAKANEMERNGETVHRFEAGQPTFKAPQKVVDAGIDALKNTSVSYTTPIGLPELRQRIVKYYDERYNVKIKSNQVCITPGSSGAFSLAFLSCFEVGDRVAMVMPCYPSYKRILESFGVEVVPLMATQNDKYQPTVPLLQDALAGGKIDGIVIASPNNPTGTTLTNNELTEVLEFCKDNGIRVIADELYHGVEFADEKSITALSIDNEAIIINSFSKYFCMTGWRLGWIVVPENMTETINNLQSNLFISAPTVSQIAAIKVFDCSDELDKNVEQYKNNRELFVNELTKMGITKFAYPEGGFYLYADVSHLTDNSAEWTNELLENANIGVTSGLDFDEARGHHTVRFSYVCSYDEAKAGLKALADYISIKQKQ